MTDYSIGSRKGTLVSDNPINNVIINMQKFNADDCLFNYNMITNYMDKTHEEDYNTTADFRSEKIKLVVSSMESYYYMIHDLLGEILVWFESNKEIEIVYCTKNLEKEKKLYRTKNVGDFIFKFFEDNGISYKIFDASKNNKLLINNFYLLNNHPNSAYSKKIFNYCKKYVKDLDVEPYRKVYLSRASMPLKNYEKNSRYFINEPLIANDDRVDDHESIEDFFKSLGFEIVNPDGFSCFEDQIDYFYSVKTIASLSSSGLSNAIFMKDGQNVVEIVTPLIHDVKSHIEEQIHFYYNFISFSKNHKYLAIQNFYRNSKKLIDSINEDANLLNYLRSL